MLSDGGDIQSDTILGQDCMLEINKWHTTLNYCYMLNLKYMVTE